jgi:UDP-N-acetylmuramyl pentapeptide phosphotransferase/UDP-N-acetylglucosamine-1-phosphate transferase
VGVRGATDVRAVAECYRADDGAGRTAAMIEQAIGRFLVLGPVALLALVLSLALMVLLQPWLARYAMARPNARSSHHQPTPQGGGISVVVATFVVAWGAVAASPALLQNESGQFLGLTATAALLAVVGAMDDMRSLSAAMRLAIQCIAVGALIAALPNQLQVLPQVPWWLERTGLFVGGVWLVNLVNFMDGIDWMTVAELVPVTGAIVLLGLAGTLALWPSVIAAALLGAILGFAPFNKPVARVFLGDVGSLPIGLVLGWLLLRLAAHGHLAAAIILPLYYFADATITLIRRVARREPFWQAHRQHFYQRATENGFAVPAIVRRVVLVNVALAALAAVTIAVPGTAVSLAALAAAIAVVAWLLLTFARAKR